MKKGIGNMTRVEVLFLGTTASIPTPKRNHPAIYFRYVGKHEYCMLFDCGEGTQRQIFLAKENFMKLNEIFITHWHADHYAGLLGLIETMSLEKRSSPLHVFAPEATRFLNTLLSVGYGIRKFQVVAHNVPFKGKEATKILEKEEYEIFSIPVKHGIPAVAYCFKEKDRVKIDKAKAKALGLPSQSVLYKKLKKEGRVEYKGRLVKLEDVSYIEAGKKVVYSGDTEACDNLIKLATNADLLILDCTYFEDIKERNHLNVYEAIEIASQANVKKLVLTHISRRYQDEREIERVARELAKNFDFDVIIAKDFMRIELK